MRRKRGGCLGPFIFFLVVILFSFGLYLYEERDKSDIYETYPVYSENCELGEKVQLTVTSITRVNTITRTVTTTRTNGNSRSDFTTYYVCRCRTSDGLQVLLKIESKKYSKYVSSDSGTITLSEPLRIAASVSEMGSQADNVSAADRHKRILVFIDTF